MASAAVAERGKAPRAAGQPTLPEALVRQALAVVEIRGEYGLALRPGTAAEITQRLVEGSDDAAVHEVLSGAGAREPGGQGLTRARARLFMRVLRALLSPGQVEV